MSLAQNILDSYYKIHGDHFVLDINDPHARFHGTQKPWEFFKAWEVITQYLPDREEISFLEIGAAKGLWSIAFLEFCKFYNKKPIYVAVNWSTPPYIENHEISWNNSLLNVKEYYKEYTQWHLIDADSRLLSTQNQVKDIKDKFDFVFIDAYHTYEAVLEDTRLYGSMAQILLMYHDITGRYRRGNSVYQAIVDSKIELDYEIISFKKDKKYDSDDMGIGIHVVDRNVKDIDIYA